MSGVLKWKSRLVKRYIQYFSNVLIMIISLLLYSNNKYYLNILKPIDLTVIEIYITGYIIIGFIYYTFAKIKNTHNSVGYIMIKTLARIILQYTAYIKKITNDSNIIAPRLSKEETNALLFTLVKLFFLPLMISFCSSNIDAVITTYEEIRNSGMANFFTVSYFNQYIYSFIFYSLFFIDTIFFTFGYMFEADILKNRIRSVEPTGFGWMVTLVCYPPFNELLGGYLNWSASDFPVGKKDEITFILRILVLLFYCIYVWATVALGTKASNLTNRGIVCKGPYAFIRHPAYVSKNMAWWISMIPTLNISGILSMMVWSFVYYLRAITEERHLITDNDYLQYCSKVPYRFIPFIW